jgi:hypothetical protein
MTHRRPIRFSCGILFAALLAGSTGVAQLGGQPGSFSRLGFGARGIGMGNALTAVTTGDVVGYYNPALAPWATYRNISASFGILSLDRNLNFISYAQPLPPRAGLSAGIINAGVSDIDGRDSDGEQTGPLKTSENLVFMSFSNRFQSGFTVGITLKLLYHHLYTDVSSTTVGIDVGLLVPVSNALTLGATVRDINSKYQWDTGQLYGNQRGNSTLEKFPMLYTIGAAYRLPDVFETGDSTAVIAADLELSDKKTLIGRVGIEIPLIPEVSLRAGLDRIDVKEKGNGVKPSIGFSARQTFGDWTPAVHYAFVLESFSPSPAHIVSLSVIF